LSVSKTAEILLVLWVRAEIIEIKIPFEKHERRNEKRQDFTG
jgi:hypothetical protein